ncbi:hypothetical protein [Flavobacterium cellulosilyticum]|uniref:Uncharacterized protein n=1 Tax=Flavobacterium cellulosilyticum TaxID=2541731 RepID=A0A4R5CDL2_9FLAO|nr:hypothetical protein [Flavobacterium cellulosilyticum]TDD95264.1 hypothetical protein E0F76_14570 [Flavobacterium cellulosilyticum]
MKNYKLILFSILLAFTATSSSTLNEFTKSTRVITIKLDEAGTGLILHDGLSNGPNIRTIVSAGDVIIWKLIPNQGIDSLVGIQVKEDNVSIFTADIVRRRDGSLIGTIGDFLPGTAESYGINYSINGVSYYHDPVIQIHD